MDKYNYLKVVLKNNVKRLIDRFKIEDNSYDSAVKLLKATYTNPDKKQNELAAQLLHLTSPNHSVSSLSEFRAHLVATFMKLEKLRCNF